MSKKINIYQISLPVDSNKEWPLEASIVCSFFADWMLENPIEQEEIFDILDNLEEDFFTHKGIRLVFRGIKKYYKEYRTLPTIDAISCKIATTDNTKLKDALNEVLLDIVSKMPLTSSLLKSTIEFLENERMKKEILDV